MQVVLRVDVDKVGKRGDIVDVADGFARNFLLPRHQAIVASKGITAQAAAMRAAAERVDAKNREAAETIAKSIVGVTLTIQARSGAEGKLFGSVTNADVMEALQQQANVHIDRRQIELHEPIKTVGAHAIPVKLHSAVQVSVQLEVVGSED